MARSLGEASGDVPRKNRSLVRPLHRRYFKMLPGVLIFHADTVIALYIFTTTNPPNTPAGQVCYQECCAQLSEQHSWWSRRRGYPMQYHHGSTVRQAGTVDRRECDNKILKPSRGGTGSPKMVVLRFTGQWLFRYVFPLYLRSLVRSFDY